MPPLDSFPNVDRLVTGGLAPFLTAARSAGESHETIAYRLRSEHDIIVSSETVRKWCIRVDAPPAPVSSGSAAEASR